MFKYAVRKNMSFSFIVGGENILQCSQTWIASIKRVICSVQIVYCLVNKTPDNCV